MKSGELGKIYQAGEIIVQQGETGNFMFIIQQGEVDVLVNGKDGDVPLSVLRAGDIFGEMSLFTHAPRSATVRSRGESRVLTVNKRGFFRRMHEDPSLAFRILEKMSERINSLDAELSQLKGGRDRIS